MKVTPLVFSDGESDYGRCLECDLRFLFPKFFLSYEKEAERYRLHQNRVEDLNYRKFLQPLMEEVCKTFPAGEGKKTGLDFGAGPGPLLRKMFEERGCQMEIYDPLFFDDKNVLKGKYDFVSCSEVIEHFHHPYEEFKTLRRLLKKGGVLGVMTLFCSSQVDFENWYYRKDPTHVCFYSEKTFLWIQKEFDFKSCTFVGGRIALFET